MMYKDRMSYYDMDPQTAQMYAPIDEYLEQTKRFSPKVMKSNYIWGIIGLSFVVLSLFCVFVVFGFLAGNWTRALLTLYFEVLAIPLLIYFIRHYGEKPHMDMLTCENVLDNDGVERVYKDYSYAKKFGRSAVIGCEYLFIKGRTVVRLAQITGCDIHEVSGEDSTMYFFRIHVRDDMERRSYDVNMLHGPHEKRAQEFLEMNSILEASQKRIKQIDYDKQKGIEQHEQ